MSKIKIEVDLDWINEGGGIDEKVKNEIINNIVERFEKSINHDITEKAEELISKKIQEKIDEKVNNITSELLNREFNLCDKWGDITRKNVRVIDLLKEKLDNFLIEKVDKDGKTNGYNSNIQRIDYIIQKNIDSTMKIKVEEAAKEVKKGLEKYIDTTLKSQIGENVAQLIGINKIKEKFNKD